LHGTHTATSRVENSAQVSSCQLKFVHGCLIASLLQAVIVYQHFTYMMSLECLVAQSNQGNQKLNIDTEFKGQVKMSNFTFEELIVAKGEFVRLICLK